MIAPSTIKSPEKLFFTEPINFEAAYGKVTLPSEQTNDSGILVIALNVMKNLKIF